MISNKKTVTKYCFNILRLQQQLILSLAQEKPFSNANFPHKLYCCCQVQQTLSRTYFQALPLTLILQAYYFIFLVFLKRLIWLPNNIDQKIFHASFPLPPPSFNVMPLLVLNGPLGFQWPCHVLTQCFSAKVYFKTVYPCYPLLDWQKTTTFQQSGTERHC